MSCCGNEIYLGPLVVEVTIPDPLPEWTNNNAVVDGEGVYFQLSSSISYVTPSGTIYGPISFMSQYPFGNSFYPKADLYNLLGMGPDDPAPTAPSYWGPFTRQISDPECGTTANLTMSATLIDDVVTVTYEIDSPYFAFASHYTPLPAYPTDWYAWYGYGDYIALNIIGDDLPAWDGTFASSASVTYDGTTAASELQTEAWYVQSATVSQPTQNGYLFRCVPYYADFPVTECEEGGPDPEPDVDDDIRLRVWPFSLDGHDFWVFRLGTAETLVYDLKTGQWAEWRSPNRHNWRAHVGMNWVGMSATTAARGFGTDIVCGDDATGQLFILDPTAGADDNTSDASSTIFTRTVTGGIPLDGREVAKCNAVTLNLALGSPITGTSADITLRTSDDMGRSWTDHGAVTVNAAEFDAVVEWRSLGLMRAPGRIFEISDEGATVRISAADLR